MKFAAANKNDLGGGDYDDVMAGVDAVMANIPSIAVRMALIGYSYGGEMAGFVEGKTDRFKGDRQRRARDRPVQRIRHRGRLVVRPLVLRKALGTH